MANIIKIKNSSVAAKVPLTGDLAYGEIALNYADGKIYYKKSDNTIQSISGGVASVSGTAPIVSSGGATPAISIPVATTSVSGYLSSTDWATFNGKQAALGFTPYNATNPSAYISSITSGNVTTALGFTPYNATNPSAYISSITSGNVTTALGYTPYNATNPSAYISSITSGNVTTALGFTPENVANKGIANGYAPLDATTKISSTYLPSYVDDVLEYANLAAFPATGTSGLIYVTVDTNKTYRWSGSAYVEISASSPGTAGSNTQVQYNSSGVFGASSGLTFDGTVLTSNTLNVSNTSYVVKPFKLITQSNAKLTIGVGDATSTVAIVALNAAETGYQDITIQGNNFVRLHTGGTSRLAVDSSGNVGIGTISPGSKLSVVGQIESTTTGFKFPDGTVQATAATGGGAWEKITANTTATTKKQYVTDTTAGAFTVTLPATPAAGDYVYFMDAANWAINNLTVARNGSTIEASATDLVLDVRGLMVQLIYDGSTWQVMSNIGPQGPIGPTGPAVGVGKIIAMAMIFGG